MFGLIVKYFGFLKAVPLLPHVFDGLLYLHTYFTNTRLLDCIDLITNEVLSWDDTENALHKYGGLQFNSRGKEIGHIHGNGILDIRFSRKIKEQLIVEGRVVPHHVFKDSGWVSFYMQGMGDFDYAIKLLRMSYLKIADHASK